jgi:hypothetical protein
MFFKVKIYRVQFITWKSWKTWEADRRTNDWKIIHWFGQYCVKHYPICLSADAVLGDVEFTFESEAHYHWFLLQQ